MQFEQNDIQTTLSLLEQYGKGNALKGTKLRFEGTGGKDVYNITAPFIDRGEQIIAGRLEGRETEYSEVVFFGRSKMSGCRIPIILPMSCRTLSSP